MTVFLWFLVASLPRPLPGFADSLLHWNEPFHAITEYKRQLFFAAGDSLHALEGIARAYEMRGKVAEALHYWGEVNYRNPQGWVRHRMARLLLQQGRPQEVRMLLMGDTSRTGRILRLLAEAWSGRYPEVRDSLQNLGLSLPALPSRRWIQTVAWLVPGVGFLWLGEPLRGLSSIGAQLGSLLWTGLLIRQRQYSDAVTVGVSLAFRFYVGGRASLLRLYRERQQEALQRALQRLPYSEP